MPFSQRPVSNKQSISGKERKLLRTSVITVEKKENCLELQ
jgi:hypothetical protein